MVPMNRVAPPPLPEGGGIPVTLPRRAKAAIVVRFLLNEGADLPLEDLPDDLQVSLTQQMGHMRSVDRATLAAVLDEFASEVDNVALSFPGGLAGALDALDGAISAHTAQRLRREAGVRQIGDPWGRLRELGADQLAPIFERESLEVAAVLLSNLPVAKAAEVLGRLPGPLARRITYAVSQTGAVTPEAVDRIGLSLAVQLDAEPRRAFADGPVERVGAILNSSRTAIRDDVLTGLDETDSGFASAVRKAIFTFANIPERVDPRDVPRVLREVDQAVLVTALAGAEAAGVATAREFILENMSARLADQLRDDMNDKGSVTMHEAETAMSTIIDRMRAMEEAGNLLLIVPEDGESG